MSKFVYIVCICFIVFTHSVTADVRYGVELNPLLGSKYISGGFNVFFPNQALELAIPFVYKGEETFWNCDYDNSRDLSVDLIARKYLRYNEKRSMPYVGLLLRHRQLDGTLSDSCNRQSSNLPYDVIHKAARNAYALNIGFRRIFRTNAYIGASFSYGQYFDNGIEGAPSPYSGKTLRDIEFFKIGYIFN